MCRLFHWLLPFLALLASTIALATEVVERADCARHFEAAGVTGTIAVLDVGKDKLYVHDRERANRRFVPASTFKIFNSLVALQTGAVKDENEIVPYGGKPQPVRQWERDMSMREAIRISNVPVYQELARRAGTERMRHYLRLAGYGNGETGKVIDRFWLDGPLRISAVEQTSFLARLARRELPFDQRNMAIVRDILRQEETPDHALFAKSGWDGQIGWWTGWIERGSDIYTFALNIDLSRMEDAAKRESVARECLKALGVL